MSLESFYGGKQGVSSVIKASFKFVNTNDQAYIDATSKGIISENQAKLLTMDECFKDPNYTDVWYGELCIIDTGNRNNPNNGKLYRRVLKQSDNRIAGTNDTTYAEYIGQISGPAGGMPYFDLGSLDDQRKKAVGVIPTLEGEENLNNATWEYAYTDKTTGLTTHMIPTAPNNEEEAWEQIKVLESSDGASIQMVPGIIKPENSDDEPIYHDTLRYTWCNVRRNIEGKESDSWVYLGFEIPYTVYDIKAVPESSACEEAYIEDNSDPDHPFYKEYEFHIPRGTRGIGPEEIFIVGEQNNRFLPEGAHLYTVDAITYDQESDTYTVNTNSQAENVGPSYWVGKWCIYNPKDGFTNTIDTDVFYIYLGSYQDVRNITLAEDGSLSFGYSDGSSIPMANKIKWINSIDLKTNLNDSDYGNLSITYNTNEIDTFDLPLIKNIEYNSGGDITAEYAGLAEQTIGNINSLKQFWIDPRGHLLGLYDSTDYRPDDNQQPQSQGLYNEVIMNPNNKYSTAQTWVKGRTTEAEDNKIAENDMSHWWHDLGIVREITGVKIAAMYNSETALSPTVILERLENIYHNGQIFINGVDRSGSFIIGKVDEGNGTEKFGAFFYDYGSSEWKYLGDWNGDSNIYFENGNNILPTLNSRNVSVHFIDSPSIGVANNSFTVDSNMLEMLGNLPWDNSSQMGGNEE